ncbi:hypothetical protein HEB94_005050 [Actinopolymorpha pittospori]|uniref:Uncharacterized protein n=1 Tax=Actinopolymorpha pittospori TaxID=648752 RepID=A0A927N3D2_9ACTN|nr:hypothetical protein [Actinopolymorpha pittospori]
MVLQPIGHHGRCWAVRIAETAAAVVKTSEFGDIDPKTAKDVLVLERYALRVQSAPVHQFRCCYPTKLGVPVVAMERVPEGPGAD